MNKTIEISPKSVVLALVVLVLAATLARIADILLGVFVAFILMTALNPLVKKLQGFGFQRLMAIWTVYLVFVAVVATLIALLIPTTLRQLSDLLTQFQFGTLASFLQGYGIDITDLSVLSSHINSIPKVFSVVTSAFSSIITGITMLVITFYLLLERENLHKHVHWFFGDKQSEMKVEKFINQLEKQIGAWVHGQLTLMFIVGLITYVGLVILGIKYALPLAILAGFLEVLPNVGPTIAAIPAILVGYVYGSPLLGMLVLIFYILIQQLENTFIVPQIMRSVVGVNPIATILILLIGYRLGGIAGAILAVPLFLVVKVVLLEFYKIKNGRDIISN